MIRCYGCMQEKSNNEETCVKCGYVNGKADQDNYYLPEGTVLQNRYLVGKVLGHGGFGITYIGFDQKLDVVIAIKEYLPTEVASRSYGEVSVTTFSGDKKEQYDYGLTRFIDEAKSLARYNHHPCIVSTSDYFEENNTAYIVMEYLDGISLAEYLKRKGGKISWQETLEIMTPVMDALREVHSTGMIHRDISPDNIYITSKGLVKLLDFGAARFAMGEKSKSLSVILKPGYAPPEQYYTNGKQGPWTDVYSLASTMYKMLTGTTPPEAVERVMEDNIVTLSKQNIEIDSKAEATILKALSVKGAERQQSIEVFGDELRAKGDVNQGKMIEDISGFAKDMNDNSYSKKINNSMPTKKLKRNYVVLMILILGISSLLYYHHSQKNNRIHDEIDSYTWTDTFSYEVDSKVDLLEKIIVDGEVYNLAFTEGSEEILEYLCESYGFDNLYIGRADGSLDAYPRVEMPTDYDATLRGWYQNEVKNVSSVHMHADQERANVTITKEVYDLSNNFIGVIGTDIVRQENGWFMLQDGDWQHLVKGYMYDDSSKIFSPLKTHEDNLIEILSGVSTALFNNGTYETYYSDYPNKFIGYISPTGKYETVTIIVKKYETLPISVFIIILGLVCIISQVIYRRLVKQYVG